ncbi:MAG: glycosyltransferase family 4 protein [Deltaproteobacteria bacterium]|nr:glycosyltransferase family 4 protein [Deltaproteobacteria bacterium]
MTEPAITFIAFEEYPKKGVIYEYIDHAGKKFSEVAVICATDGDEDLEETHNGVHVHRVHVKTLKKMSLEAIRFTNKARRLYRRTQKDHHPCLVHVFSYVGCRALRHGSPEGKWVYHTRSGAIKSTLIHKISKPLQVIDARGYDAIFTNAEDIVGRMEGKVFVVSPMGVNMDRFRPEAGDQCVWNEYGIPSGSSVLIYHGRLDPSRKIETLIEAFNEVHTVQPRTSLILMGEDPNVVRLKEVAERLGVSESVYFIGRIDYPEVPSYLAASDLGLAYIPITIEYDKQPPLKTLEYLSCGLPVVATGTEGNKGFVEDGQNGVIAGDSSSEYAEAVLKVLSVDGLREKIAGKARESVKPYDWQRLMENRFFPAYDELLSDL